MALKTGKITERMNELQWRDALKTHIAAHPGIKSQALMRDLPIPKIKPMCHTNHSYVLADMVRNGDIRVEYTRPYPSKPYSIQSRYYPINDTRSPRDRIRQHIRRRSNSNMLVKLLNFLLEKII